MIEILKRGIVPGELTKVCKCSECSSILRIPCKNIVHSYYRDDDFWKWECPVCNAYNCIYSLNSTKA